MTWYDDKLPASLGGIPLFYREVDTPAGRRTVTHEFYGDSREAYVEDVGPVTWNPTIDVFLVGENYHIQRNELEALLNTKGPHEFVHPLRGPVMVRLGSPARLRESVSEGGMVRIGQLQLVQAGSRNPQVTAETGPRLVSMSFSVAETLAATTRLNVERMSDKNRLGLLAALRNATAAIRKANARVAAVLNRIDSASNAIQLFEESLDTALNTPNALMSSLTGLGLSIFNLFGQFEWASRSITVEEPVFPLVATAAAAVQDISSFTTAPEETAWIPPGPQQELAEAAHAELQFQMQALGYVAGAGIAGLLPYASASEAGAMLEVLAAGLKTAMSDPGLPAAAHEELFELRATLVRNLIDQQAKLPRVVKITTPATMPAVVLAWELYGDANRTSELALRNRVAHPSYVPEGIEMEVVVDV